MILKVRPLSRKIMNFKLKTVTAFVTVFAMAKVK